MHSLWSPTTTLRTAPRLLRDRITGLVLSDTLTIRAGDRTARFRVDNRWEHDALTTYRSPPDRTVLADFADRLRADDVVWDVGANVGVFTCLAAADRPTERVVAIEPHPKNTDRLAVNLVLNDRDAVVQELALADETGEATLRRNSPDVAGTFGRLREDAGETTVRTVAGDDLVDDGTLPAPDVLKLDVQGSELAALRGLPSSLSSARLVYCNVYEKHFETGTEGGEVHERLTGAGLTVCRFGSWDGGYFLRGVRDSVSDA